MLVAALLASAAASAADRPQRIVSTNLCTDQLLMLLVEPERIAGVTYLASRQESSALAEKARGLPVTRGVAEEVIARDPDLVVGGMFSARATTELLRRLGYRVEVLAPETSLADIRANILRMGEAVGEPERAAALAAQFDAELAAITDDNSEAGPKPLFTNYGANGYVSGSGTLEADVARAAGYDVLGEKLGILGSAPVPLEALLFEPVDVITLSHPAASLPALAEEELRHPALRRYVRERTSVDIPPAVWACGTPATLEAVRRLVEARPDLGTH